MTVSIKKEDITKLFNFSNYTGVRKINVGKFDREEVALIWLLVNLRLISSECQLKNERHSQIIQLQYKGCGWCQKASVDTFDIG